VPIVLIPPSPADVLGPGLRFSLQTDLIGPLPPDSRWQWSISPDIEDQQELWGGEFASSSHVLTIDLGKVPLVGQARNLSHHVDDGEPVYVNSRIVSDQVGTVDTMTPTTATWSNTAGLYEVMTGTAGAGGFTDSDRQQLVNVAAWTVPDLFANGLRLFEVTTGPSGGQVASEISEWAYGILIRLTAVPADISWDTPDQNYSVRTLAVCRVFRETDIFMRVPIHRSSQIIPLDQARSQLYVFTQTVGLWSPGLTLEVDFGPGVQGQVYLMRLP